MASRMVLDPRGDVRAEYEDSSGATHLTTHDLVSLVDAAVAKHPEISADGPNAAGRRLLDRGFNVQSDIDVRARRVVQDGVVVMSRRHIDGIAFQNPRRLAPFFDVNRVRDLARPPH